MKKILSILILILMCATSVSSINNSTWIGNNEVNGTYIDDLNITETNQTILNDTEIIEIIDINETEEPVIEEQTEEYIIQEKYDTQAWWNTEWDHYKPLILNSSQVPSTLTNFTVLINITDTDLRDDAQPDGDDIVFVLTDNTTTLSHEIEYYDGGNGTLVAWVKIPSLAHDSNTIINMYYGNDTCGSQEDIPNAWDDDYEGVYHLVDATDSKWTHNGTNQGATFGTHWMGGYADFEDDEGDWINIGDTATYNSLHDKDKTLEMYVMPDVFGQPGGTFDRYLSLEADSFSGLWYTTTNGYQFRVSLTSQNAYAGSNNAVEDVWVYLTGVFNMSEEDTGLYVNGTFDEWNATALAGVEKDAGRFDGIASCDGTNNVADIVVTEVRISSGIRSANWILTSYNTIINGTDNGFFSVGSEKNAPAGENHLPKIEMPTPANNSANVIKSTSTLTIYINDTDGDGINYTIETNNSNDIGSQYNWTSEEAEGLKTCSISGLQYSTTYKWWVNATDNSSDNTSSNWTKAMFTFTVQDKTSFVAYGSSSFGAKLNTTKEPQNDTIVMRNPNPAHQQGNVLVTQATWNITIKDPEGDTFNWSIEVSNGDSNNSNDDTNGSKFVELTTPLNYNTEYTVWVNGTDSGNGTSVNNTYNFTTEPPMVFELYGSSSFGAKVDVEADYPEVTDINPNNGSTGVDMYVQLSVTIDEPQDDKFNVTWKTNATGPWTILQYNDTCTDGTFTYRATFANASTTKYWWRLELNDSNNNWYNATYHFTTKSYTWGDWSDPWTFNYSVSHPTSLTATAWNQSAINLSWVYSDAGIDSVVLVMNESGWNTYPNAVDNGTELYNGTNKTFNQTGLSKATTYYYSIWGYNITENNYSLEYDSAQGTTQGDIGISLEYPNNKSTGISRPPINISVGLTGSGLDVYIYFWNRTPATETWSLLANWIGGSAGRYEVLNLDTINGTNEFIWGNTTMYWSVNVTDGASWLNKSYWYNTTGSRYDIDNNDNVFVGDLSEVWANRGGTFDGYYDTDNNDNIFVGDLSTIWANR